jgi:DNA-binding LacI/PurR family transcriptional regulator
MARERFVTMADVARAAGVHVSTVSLGLRNSPLLPETTRKAVQAVADRLHYRPHPLVATLMRRRRAGKKLSHAPVLAFVTAFPTRDGWRRTSPVPAGYLRGARQRAEEKGFKLDEFWMRDGGMTPRRFEEVLLTRNIQGLLLAPVPEPETTLDLRWDQFCAVALGMTLATPVHHVSHDHYGGMLEAVDRCRALGYRRIGFAVNAVAQRQVRQRWLAAYLVKQHELGATTVVPPLVAESWSEPVVRAWFRRHEPDVIVSNHPVPLRDWIQGWRRQVPRDLGLVNLSCTSLHDPTSGINQDGDLIGARAIELLVNLVEQNERGIPASPNTLLIPGSWNAGRTVVPQPTNRGSVA